jgi:hypothetical protein
MAWAGLADNSAANTGASKLQINNFLSIFFSISAQVIRFSDKNCSDEIFIYRLRPKCNFALPPKCLAFRRDLRSRISIPIKKLMRFFIGIGITACLPKNICNFQANVRDTAAGHSPIFPQPKANKGCLHDNIL